MGFKDAGKPHYLGHRERLRKRFRGAGPDALPDYELLELVLFRAAPRHDTKPIAKALIARFGTFAEALNAPEELLREIPGIGEAAITELKLVRAASLRLIRGEVLERPVLSSWAQVLDYCRASMGFASKEQFRILFLDKRNQIIADEVQQTGTVDHTPVYVREVVKRALELSATAIVLVHNHPSGDPTPSRADIEMTKQIVAAAKPLGVVVLDDAGNIKSAQREDGASMFRLDIARGKAWAAVAMGASSKALAKRAKDNPNFFITLAATAGGRFLPQTGAALIKDKDGTIIGAAGASGGTGEEDEACCVVGIEAAGLTADASA